MDLDPKRQLESWIRQFDRVADAVVGRGGQRSEENRVAPPASLDEVEDVEKELGIVLPSSFRTFLTQQSSELRMEWSLPSDVRLEGVLRDVFSGGCDFSLSSMVSGEEARKQWIESCFPNPENAYDNVWHNKRFLAHVPNGDQLAFDLSTGPDAAVVYLSHDDGEGHGRRMANSFADLMNRWAPLGCPGNEDWQWLPFCAGKPRLIDPACFVANTWFQWLGLELHQD